MKRSFAALFLAAALLSSFAASSRAEDFKPDDQVVFDLSAETWVTTKSARVFLNVEAAVTASNAGAMRTSMMKAVNDVVKADWKLTGFGRSQDQTGMERWSAQFEARVPENDLNNLSDNAKKNSKAGMQITVGGVDFSPTLEERQAAISQTRTQIYKQANEQLAALNAALSGRNYRIGMIDFIGDGPVPMRTMSGMNVRMARAAMKAQNFGGAMDSAEGAPSMEMSEKISLTARVIFSAVPPVASNAK